MFLLYMLDQLIFAIVADITSMGHLALVGLVVIVPSLVVVTVSDCSEHLAADFACVRSLTGVDTLVNLQVASFIEDLLAQDFLTRLLVNPYRVETHKFMSLNSSRILVRRM